MACRDCLCVTEEIAAISGSAAANSNAGSSQRSSPNSASRVADSSSPPLGRNAPDACCVEALATTPIAQDGSDSQTSNLIRGAVFRAMCLFAGHGLLDPVEGPRVAAESLATSLLSRSGCRSPMDPTGVKVPVHVEISGVVNDPPVAEDAAGAGRAEGEVDGSMGRIKSAAQLLGSPRPCLRLRDVRWGLEVLLACVAMDVANEVELVAQSNTLNTIPSAEANKKGALVDGRLEEGNQEDETTTCPNHHGLAAHPTVAKKRAARAQIAYSLVAYACQQSHIGPTLVASILLAWIPHLLERRRPTSTEATAVVDRGVSRGGRALQPQHPADVPGNPLPIKDLRKQQSREAQWCSPAAGEHEAAVVLVVGAIRMLVFMVKSFSLVPLSDFSAEKLALAAEAGIALGTMAVGGNTTTARAKTSAAPPQSRRQSMGYRARAAGETLILELLLEHPGGGLEALLPALTNTGGFIHLQQSAASAPAHGVKAPSVGAGAVGEERGHVKDGSILTFRTNYGDTNFTPDREGGRANIDARSRLKIPVLSSHGPALSPQGVALSPRNVETADNSRGFEVTENRRMSGLAPDSELDGSEGTTTDYATPADVPTHVPRTSATRESPAERNRDSGEATVHRLAASSTNGGVTPLRSSGRSGKKVFPLASDGTESSERANTKINENPSRTQMGSAAGRTREKGDIDGKRGETPDKDNEKSSSTVGVVQGEKLGASVDKPEEAANAAEVSGDEMKQGKKGWVSNMFSFRFGKKKTT